MEAALEFITAMFVLLVPLSVVEVNPRGLPLGFNNLICAPELSARVV
jgi:hypothetical protein